MVVLGRGAVSYGRGTLVVLGQGAVIYGRGTLVVLGRGAVSYGRGTPVEVQWDVSREDKGYLEVWSTLQGYPAQRKHPPPSDRHRALGIGLP